MIVKFIVANPNGEVTNLSMCVDYNVEEVIDADPNAYRVDYPDGLDVTSVWFDGTTLRDKGTAPTTYHVFDYTIKGWVEDATKKSAYYAKHANVQRAERLSHFIYVPKNTAFQVDPISLGLIAGRSLKLIRKQIEGSPLPNVEWRSADNQIIEFSGEEFIAFAEAADEYADSVYKQSWVIKDGF